uniref:Uncharacterized protein n=1 Tax=Panagrolaimus davidi TaxID=227884 RepID=A0A914P7A2_9BILA
MDFFVAKGIITKEQASHVCDTRISVTNNGKTITGVFKDEIGIRDVIEDETRNVIPGYRRRRGDKCVAMQSNTNKTRYLKLKFSIPKTKSTLKKMKGVEWYLCLEKDGVLTFKHKTMVNPSDFLITEMKSETEFTLTSNETTSINACYNNLNPII